MFGLYQYGQFSKNGKFESIFLNLFFSVDLSIFQDFLVNFAFFDYFSIINDENFFFFSFFEVWNFHRWKIIILIDFGALTILVNLSDNVGECRFAEFVTQHGKDRTNHGSPDAAFFLLVESIESFFENLKQKKIGTIVKFFCESENREKKMKNENNWF